MRDIKFKFLMENREVTKPYDLRELIDANAYVNIECEYNSKIKQELQYTGLKDKNGTGLTEVYEGDIISETGKLKGNIYENDKEPTDIVIPQLGTKAWNNAYKEAVARGYDYSE